MNRYVIRFSIEGLPKTTNAIRGNAHWAITYKEASAWKKKVWLKVSHIGRPESPLSKARITLIRKSSVEPDPEGLVSTFKPILDGLIESMVISNDTSKVIGFPDYRWEKASPGKGMIEVVVEEWK